MLKVSPNRFSRHAFWVRCLKLVLFLSPLTGAYFYGYTQSSSPLFCPIKALTGIPCPSCGMTRAFMAIALGNWQDALNYHFFAPVLFFGLLIVSLHLFLEIVIGRKISLFYERLLKNWRIQLTGIGSFLLYYVIRLDDLTQSDSLIEQFYHLPLGLFVNQIKEFYL